MKKSIDFFSVLRAEGYRKANPVTTVFLVLMIGAMVGQIGIYLYLSNANRQWTAAVEENDMRINGQQVKDLLTETQTVKDYQWFVSRDMNTARLMQEHVNGTGGFRSELFRIVLDVAPADVRLQSFSYAEDTVNITCTTRDNAPPAAYTAALVETGLFSEVAYHGFTAVSVEQNGQTKITFPIVCRLKRPEVKQNDQA